MADLFKRGDEIVYQAHPGALPEYGFVERDTDGPLVLCRFWHNEIPARLRTTANGERVPRGLIYHCPSGHSAQDVHLALGFYCRSTEPAEVPGA